MRIGWILLALATAATPGAAQSAVRDVTYSAAYWRDVCAGAHSELSRAEQARMCGLYLSSFHDAADEYADAGVKLFCPPGTISAETMRRDFLAYMAELPETEKFFPAGRALMLALMRAYPCPGK